MALYVLDVDRIQKKKKAIKAMRGLNICTKVLRNEQQMFIHWITHNVLVNTNALREVDAPFKYYVFNGKDIYLYGRRPDYCRLFNNEGFKRHVENVAPRRQHVHG